MLYRLSTVMGNVPETWKTGYDVAYRSGSNQFPGAPTNPSRDQVIQKLSNSIQSASSVAIDLIYQMLQWDPNLRPSAADCLKHKFFTGSKQSQRNYSSSLIQRQVNSQTMQNKIQQSPSFEFHSYKDSTLRRLGMQN